MSKDSLAIRARTGYMAEDDALFRWMTAEHAVTFSRMLYPTSGLDPERRRDFLNVILKAVAADGVTVIMSSHQLHEVERVADRVAFMRDGRIVLEKELDVLKEASRRIRVVFQGDAPADLADWEGVRRVETEGRMYWLHVSGDVDAVVARLRTYNPFVVDVVEYNLEDLYFETAQREESRS